MTNTIKEGLVSVILPTYNRALLIERAISSVLNQTYPNIELIVIDDGSTDDTCEKLKGFNEKISYIYQDNSGVSSARNVGIQAASGEFIAFIDSDDVWKKSKLEQQLNYFNENNEIGLCFTNVSIINSDGSVSKKPEVIKHTKNDIYDIKQVFLDPYFGLPTVIIKREIIDVVGFFNESLKTAEDLDLFLRISLKTKSGYLHKSLVDVYLTEGSLSSVNNSFEDNINVVTKFVEENNELCKSFREVIKDVLFRINYEYAKSLQWYGDSKGARKRITEAHKHRIKYSSLFLFLKTLIK